MKSGGVRSAVLGEPHAADLGLPAIPIDLGVLGQGPDQRHCVHCYLSF